MVLRQVGVVLVLISSLLLEFFLSSDGLSRQAGAWQEYRSLQEGLVLPAHQLLRQMREAHYLLYKSSRYLADGLEIADIQALMDQAVAREAESRVIFAGIRSNQSLLPGIEPVIAMVAERMDRFAKRIETVLKELVESPAHALVTLQAADTEFGSTAAALGSLIDRSAERGILLAAQTSQMQSEVRFRLLVAAFLLGLLALVLVMISIRFMFRPLEALIRKELAEKLRALEELDRAQHLASLGTLVTGVAHEFNTPLGNSVTLVSYMREMQAALSRELADPQLVLPPDFRGKFDGFRKSLELMDKSLDSAVALIRTFKLVGTAQSSGPLTEFKLDNLLSALELEMAQSTRDRKGHWIVEGRTGLILNSYPESLMLCLQQIYRNCLMHGVMPEAGEGSTPLVIHTRVEMEGSILVLSISDNGPGVPERYRHHLFEPFWTLRTSPGCVGLGLYIVQSHLHSILKGSISLASRSVDETSHGTTVTLRLPTVLE